MHFLSITGSWWLIQIHLLLTFIQLVCFFPNGGLKLVSLWIYVVKFAYPPLGFLSDFEVDMNGKRFAWQVGFMFWSLFLHLRHHDDIGSNHYFYIFIYIYIYICVLTPLLAFFKGIAKLPFIDEARLLAEVRKIEHTLTVCCLSLTSLIFCTY